MTDAPTDATVPAVADAPEVVDGATERDDHRTRSRAHRLAFTMLTMGVAHLVAPEPAHQVLPASPGAPQRWSRVVAGIEAGAGVLLLVDDRRARRAGAWLALGALASSTAAAVRQAAEIGRPTSPKEVQAWARLPMQVPALLSTYRLARG